MVRRRGKTVITPGLFPFPSQGRPHRAHDGLVIVEPGEAEIARDAGHDFVRPPLGNLVRQVGVGYHWPAGLPEVDGSVGNGLFRDIGEEQAEGHHDRHGHRLFNPVRYPQPMAHRHVAGDYRYGRLVPAHGDTHIVCAGSFRDVKAFDALICGIATPVVEQFRPTEAYADRYRAPYLCFYCA